MRQKALDLNMLQMFVAAAEERSMSGAALRVGATQSAVSQSVRQLEACITRLSAMLPEPQHP